MKIGVPREVKDHEYRVGMTPAGVHALVKQATTWWSRPGPGRQRHPDRDYEGAGARRRRARDGLGQAEMVIKVKEPLRRSTSTSARADALHLPPPGAAARADRRAARASRHRHRLRDDRRPRGPAAAADADVGGRRADGGRRRRDYLQRNFGGRGTLLAGVPGVPPGDVVIIGGGIVGINSAKMALGLGAGVAILEPNLDRMRSLDDIFHGELTTLASNPHNLTAAVRRADLLIGAVLIPGGRRRSW